MDHVFGVRGFQSAANLQHDLRRFRVREFASFLKQYAEVPAFHEIHGDELDSVGLAQIENSNNILVRHLTRENQFLLEALQNFRIPSEFGANQLERNQAV